MKNEENEETKFKNPSEKRKERERDLTALRDSRSLFFYYIRL